MCDKEDNLALCFLYEGSVSGFCLYIHNTLYSIESIICLSVLMIKNARIELGKNKEWILIKGTLHVKHAIVPNSQ